MGKKRTRDDQRRGSLSPRELIATIRPVACRDQSISRTLDKSSFRISKVEQSPPSRPGRPPSAEKGARKKIRLGHSANFLPPRPPPSAFSSLRASTGFQLSFPAETRTTDPDHSTVPKHLKTLVREYLHRGKRRRRSKRRKETSRKFQSLGDGFASHPTDMDGRRGGIRQFESGYSFRIERNYPTFFSFLSFLYFGRGNSVRAEEIKPAFFLLLLLFPRGERPSKTPFRSDDRAENLRSADEAGNGN